MHLAADRGAAGAILAEAPAERQQHDLAQREDEGTAGDVSDGPPAPQDQRLSAAAGFGDIGLKPPDVRGGAVSCGGAGQRRGR